MKRTTLFHDTPKDGPIDEIFVFIASDETGDGIMATAIGNKWMPLITSKREVAMNLRSPARNIGLMQGKKIRLVRFSSRETLEEIT